jgi:putative peptidoglycan lipid II flippase
VLAVLGPALAEVFLAHGATSIASARYMGQVFAVLCLGLVPYTIFQLQLRVFYASHDSRTPALIGVATMLVNIVFCYLALDLLPPGLVVAGLGAGFGLGNVAGSALAWFVLRRRLHGLAGRDIGASLLRMHAAAIPAAVLALAITVAADRLLGEGRASALVSVTVAGTLALLAYVALAYFFRVRELTALTGMVLARLRR